MDEMTWSPPTTRRPGEDWFTWMVRAEGAAGNTNPVLTVAMAEDRILKMGMVPS